MRGNKELFRGLTTKQLNLMEQYKNLFSDTNNYQEYRTTIQKISATGTPLLPFIGVTLRDITIIEEVNKVTRDTGIMQHL